MSAYINEDLISAHDGANFEIIKETKTSIEDGETQYVISHLKYKSDVLHKFYNSLYTAKVKVGDCTDCGYDASGFDGVVWGDILVLGLGLGLVPQYIKNVKGPTSVDVIEENAEIVSTVDWLHSDINVITHDEWSYTTSKEYDLIIVDLWAEPDDISDDHKTTLVNNYNNNLKTGGKIIIPISGDVIS